VAAALAEATTAPHRVVGLTDVEGPVAATLDTRPGEAWVIRPDGHVAAVLAAPTAKTVHAAVRRLLGQPA